ncbi:hypothetical protein BV898_19388 [Hypsibius exemplaris]|uniref:Uncharacterized protein n=1 Tax=Hypsibius exemplaris TaxID=2072580 RepID=A0A9X6NLD9_HYPEX|nr:hypothetical protein BV898_19388 [Hypsibius exemplaris]
MQQTVIIIFLIICGVVVGSRLSQPRAHVHRGARVQLRQPHVKFGPSQQESGKRTLAQKRTGAVRSQSRAETRAVAPTGLPKPKSSIMKAFASKFTGKAGVSTFKDLAKSAITMGGGAAVAGGVASAIAAHSTSGEQQSCIECYVIATDNRTDDRESVGDPHYPEEIKASLKNDTVDLIVVIFGTVGGVCGTMVVIVVINVKCCRKQRKDLVFDSESATIRY